MEPQTACSELAALRGARPVGSAGPGDADVLRHPLPSSGPAAAHLVSDGRDWEGTMATGREGRAFSLVRRHRAGGIHRRRGGAALEGKQVSGGCLCPGAVSVREIFLLRCVAVGFLRI